MLRYRVTKASGKRAENTSIVGLVRDLPTEKAAWIEIGKLSLADRINDSPVPGPILFCKLSEHYLRADFGSDVMRPNSDGTTLNMNHIVRDYLNPRFGQEAAKISKLSTSVLAGVAARRDGPCMDHGSEDSGRHAPCLQDRYSA